MTEARIKVDLNYCTDAAIGPQKGLSIKDFDAFGGRLDGIHREIADELKLGLHAFREVVRDDLLKEDIKEYATWARSIFRDFVVIGIGGSSLGTRALHDALSHPLHNTVTHEQRGSSPRFFVLENPDPTSVKAVLETLDLTTTLVNVVTKSGSTAETWAIFSAIFEPLKAAVPAEHLRDHVVVTTDLENGDLIRIAGEMNFRAFGIPKGVGGRYSVVSPVGLLPMAILGHDVDAFLQGARDMDTLCRREHLPLKNPAYAFALTHYLMDEIKDVRQNVLFPYSDRLSTVGDWFRQLWAESLGKKMSTSGDVVNVGPTPIKALGTVDQHSQLQLFVEGPADKLITFIDVADLTGQGPIPSVFPDLDSASYLGGQSLGLLVNCEKLATEYALTRAGRPNLTVTVASVGAYEMGQLMMMLMVATSVAGKLYEVNPYDQPGVEESKTATYCLMGRKGFAERKAELTSRYPRSPKFVVA